MRYLNHSQPNINGFIGFNPITSFVKTASFPNIHPSVFTSPFSFIVGDVRIRSNVYIAPFVSIRADEGTPFYIGKNSNLQDAVILHGLKNKTIMVQDKPYSIYIGNQVSCAHRSLIHGPCVIMDNVFIGFGSIIYNAVIGEGCFISTDAIVTNGVTLAKHRFVPPGATIDTQEKANKLSAVPQSSKEFAEEVQRVNKEFPATYSHLFGKYRCSCGLFY